MPYINNNDFMRYRTTNNTEKKQILTICLTPAQFKLLHERSQLVKVSKSEYIGNLLKNPITLSLAESAIINKAKKN